MSEGPAGTAPEQGGAFGGFIGPRTLLEQVRGTTPWLLTDATLHAGLPASGRPLHELATHSRGWLAIILAAERLPAAASPSRREWVDYFLLCLASHFATVATFVPTDVDTKIRHHLWFRDHGPDELELLFDAALGLERWDVRPVSRRFVEVPGHAPVSGHDGERLSVLAAGMLRAEAAGAQGRARQLEEAIAAELEREARAFLDAASRTGRETLALQLAATLTHNAGDLDQGLAARRGRRFGARQKETFGRLAHERPERHGGAFMLACRLYRELVASEGHRHYPLRKVQLLRASPELLLPIGPFFDGWGGTLARHGAWDTRQQADVVSGIVAGRRRVRGEQGYARALAGFDRAHPQGLFSGPLHDALRASVRRDLRDPGLRRAIALPRASFESSLGKAARRILDGSRHGAKTPR